MTYQNIGYWIGQANDASTGNHPTGWTTGQRWSETASEWNTMYNTEYASARDTSTGQAGMPSGLAHPTGWATNQLWSLTATQWNTMWGLEWTAARDTSGASHPTGWVTSQLWSVTASQWNTMYTTEYNNARDTSSGQPNKPSGLAHPTGWVSAQLWSATATQWNTMWGTEWVNARDPQGYSYSYPGQATNAVFWSQSASYWRSQYDAWYGYAHGDSNVWNSRYSTGYSDGDAAAQNTWRPPVLNQGVPAGAVNSVPDNQWANLTGAAYTATRTGYYALYGECMVSGLSGSYNSGQQGQLRILRDGATVIVTGTSAGLKPDNNTADTMIACFVVYGPVPVGAVFQVQVGTSDLPAAGGTRNYYSGKLYWIFVPETSYPK